MDEKTSAFPIINDRYRIINTIASGGMATIYRAEDLILDRSVAIKILKRDLSNNPIFKSQFEVEAKASAKLSHPNIVTTYDFGYFGDRLFIAMEFVEGIQLKNYVTTDMPLFEKLELLKQACVGLGYAHKNNIIHCDIKPQNMIVNKDGVLKLTDFGLSFALDSSHFTSDNDEIWGSPYYIAPEIAKGKIPTKATDVYSMGIVLYEILTGRLPFQGNDALELIEFHQTENPTPPSEFITDFPKDLEKIILKAINKNPADRFKDSNFLLAALSDLYKEDFNVSNTSSIENRKLEKINTISDKKNKPQKNKIDWITILLSLLAVLTVGGLIPFWLFIYYSINR